MGVDTNFPDVFDSSACARRSASASSRPDGRSVGRRNESQADAASQLRIKSAAPAASANRPISPLDDYSGCQLSAATGYPQQPLHCSYRLYILGHRQRTRTHLGNNLPSVRFCFITEINFHIRWPIIESLSKLDHQRSQTIAAMRHTCE